jgi:hypothetical protein
VDAAPRFNKPPAKALAKKSASAQNDGTHRFFI